MKWSLKVARVLGIDVYLHVTFLLLLGFIGLAHWLPERSAASALTAITFFTGLFVCVLLHEYGHALAARRYGIRTRDITLLPIGGVARLERMPEKPGQELWVALAGPAVNVVIAGSLAVGLVLSGTWQPLNTLSTTQGNLLERLLVVNVFLVLFNLLPAFPMDGGRVLRAILALRMDYSRATRIAANIGQGMAMLFGLAGLFGNPMLLVIAVFVWFGASQEAAAAEMKTSFAGVPVREAMITDFRAVSPATTLREITELLLAGNQQDFPVVENGRVVGLLLRQDVFKALQKSDPGALVALAMRREFETVEDCELLDSAFGRTGISHGMCLPVLRRGTFVGLLTAENIGELLIIRSALGGLNHNRTSSPLVRDVPPMIPIKHAATQH